MFVYLITNTINGKRYVGQTSQTLAARWYAHVCKNNCRYLYHAIHKHGKENFTIEILFSVPTRELADEFEIEYIGRYNTLAPSGYNLCPGGKSPSPEFIEMGRQANLGRKTSEETKKKQSLAHKGKKLSLEQRQKISEFMRGNKRSLGKPVSEEARRRMSESHTGLRPSVESRQKMSESRKRYLKNMVLNNE